MKKYTTKKTALMLAAAAMLTAMLSGCGGSQDEGRVSGSTVETTITGSAQADSAVSAGSTVNEAADSVTVNEVEIRFGDDGAPFVMHLEDNDTATAIARHVGTSEWRLPIYDYDNFENWEVMQYYDIPSRYEIPSNSETVTSEQAGDVYYSEPNRIILFYQDGEVTGDYTKIGTIEHTEEFRAAVENNPVLEGWGNKIVRISSME